MADVFLSSLFSMHNRIFPCESEIRLDMQFCVLHFSVSMVTVRQWQVVRKPLRFKNPPHTPVPCGQGSPGLPPFWAVISPCEMWALFRCYTCITRLLGGITRLFLVKCLEQCLTHYKHSYHDYYVSMAANTHTSF